MGTTQSQVVPAPLQAKMLLKFQTLEISDDVEPDFVYVDEKDRMFSI
jgi:hypothetical protein